MAPAGEIIAVRDQGTVWEVVYRSGDGALHRVAFDWRRFVAMYESEAERSFYADYAFSRGRQEVERYFIGRRITVIETDEGKFVQLAGRL